MMQSINSAAKTINAEMHVYEFDVIVYFFLGHLVYLDSAWNIIVHTLITQTYYSSIAKA